jgi:hypothetical protein
LKKTGLLHTKIRNNNIIYSSLKSRKSSSLPLKSSSWLFSLDAFKYGNNTYRRRIRRRSNLCHIFREKSASNGPGNMLYYKGKQNASIQVVQQSCRSWSDLLYIIYANYCFRNNVQQGRQSLIFVDAKDIFVGTNIEIDGKSLVYTFNLIR